MNISDCVIDRVWTLSIGVLMAIEAPALIPWLIPLAMFGLIHDCAVRECVES